MARNNMGKKREAWHNIDFIKKSASKKVYPAGKKIVVVYKMKETIKSASQNPVLNYNTINLF
ncbi:MAG: hypothetical protein JXN64_02350 [Spirochaetes bacterium]|nr:hypothetical protein [Spirochaetota bacterium]